MNVWSPVSAASAPYCEKVLALEIVWFWILSIASASGLGAAV